jgi:hypothetical protein
VPGGFKWLEKKRGARRTGSRIAGGVGEALFFGSLLLLGGLALTGLLLAQVLKDTLIGVPREGLGFWIALLVVAAFIVIGGGRFAYAVLWVGTSRERRSAIARRAATIELISDAAPLSGYPNIPDDEDLTNSPGITLAYRLPAYESPAWKLTAATVFCATWCVLTVVVAIWALRGHVKGAPDVPLSIFAGVLVAVGIWSIFYFVRQLTLLTGVGPTQVEISAHPLYPGREYEVYLSQAGRHRYKWMELRLECQEGVSYQQGTDLREDFCTVFREVIFRREEFEIDHDIQFEQQARFRAPLGAMHSFRSEHNSIRWQFVVEGQTEQWPKYSRSFPVVIYPLTSNSGATDGAAD